MFSNTVFRLGIAVVCLFAFRSVFASEVDPLEQTHSCIAFQQSLDEDDKMSPAKTIMAFEVNMSVRTTENRASILVRPIGDNPDNIPQFMIEGPREENEVGIYVASESRVVNNQGVIIMAGAYQKLPVTDNLVTFVFKSFIEVEGDTKLIESTEIDCVPL